MWYPAVPGTGAPAQYLPGAWKQLQLGLPIGESRLDRIRDSARERARPLPGRSPLIVFEPGLGFAVPQYAVIAERLVRDGFIVVGVTPTGSANLTVLDGKKVGPTRTGNPSGFEGEQTEHDKTIANRLLRMWVADARYAASATSHLPALHRLSRHILPGAVAYAGHSFGGTAALEACHEDPHCRAAANLDGALYGSVTEAGLPVPTLLLQHGGSCIGGRCAPTSDADREDVHVAEAFRAASAGSVKVKTIPGVGHLALTDYGIYYLASPLRHLLGLGPNAGVLPLTQTADLIAGTVRKGLARPRHPRH